MVDRSPHGLSRIPIPVKSTSVVQNGSVDFKLSDQTLNGNLDANVEVENGDPVSSNDVDGKKEKGFETFLMTGDMIIRTTASPKTRRDASSRNASDSSDSCVAVDMETPHQFSNDSIEDSPKLNRNFQRSAESGFEDQGQLSASSTLELQPSKNGETKGFSSSGTGCDVMSQSQSSAASSTISSVSSDMKSDISEQTVILNESDSGLISPQEESIKDEENFNIQVKSSESIETVAIEDKPHAQNLEKSESLEKAEKSKLVTSKSAEKIVHEKSGHQQQHVRTSKSQELKSDGEFAIVDIDIDDNMAYSLDQIPQHGSQSIENIDHDHVSRSLHSSPEHRSTDKAFIPGFISIDMKKGRDAQGEANDIESPLSSPKYSRSPQRTGHNVSDRSIENSPNTSNSSHRSERDSFDPSRDPNLLEYQPPCTVVDRPSAQRLAKRLYQLDGFRKSDVSRHLSKK